MKFGICVFFREAVEKIQVSVKSNKDSRYVFDHISLICSWNEKDISDKRRRDNQNTFYIQRLFFPRNHAVFFLYKV